MFEKLCKEMSAYHKVLLFHSKLRWLSKRKIFTRVLEFKDELLAFFKSNDKFDYCKRFKTLVWYTD